MALFGHLTFPAREAPWTQGDGADPALLRELFDAHGAGFLQRLRGPFAVAVWDGTTLLLARDAFGQRPLFYCEKDGAIWFASDVQALRRADAPLGQLERGALSDYLELGYVPAPGSIWSGVRKLPAGHVLRAGVEGVEVRRWYELPAPGSAERPPSRIAVRARLEETVVGLKGIPLFLEGELPSCALLALLTRKHGKVRTYAEADDALAHRIAERFRSDHYDLAVDPLKEVPGVLAESPEPIADARYPGLAAALRAIGGPALTGAGGEELFGGHARYLRAARMPQSQRAARAADLLRVIAPERHRGRLQRAASELGSRGAGRARALVELFSFDERRALLGAHARSAQAATVPADGADAAIAFDLEVALADGTLALQHAAASCAGVEARSPLLEPRLAQAVVPPQARHKLGRAYGNRLLREAVADLLPRDALTPGPRAAPPAGAWLRGPLRAMLHDLVATPTARIRTLFDPRGIDAVLRHSLAPRGDGRQAWALFALEVWAREQRR